MTESYERLDVLLKSLCRLGPVIDDTRATPSSQTNARVNRAGGS